MKIAIVANTTWNIYNFRMNIIRKLTSEGHEVVVLAPVDKFISYTETIPEVLHIPLRHLHRDGVNPFRDLRLFLELMRHYRIHQPDLVLHYTIKPNIYGAWAARRLGIPSVAVITGLGYAMIHNGLINRIARILYKNSLRWHRKVIFENEDDRQLFESAGLVSPKKAVSVKGCGVNTEFFKPLNDGRTDEVVTFAFIGRLLYDKGVREFVEAARVVRQHHQHVRFWLIGEVDRENPSSVSHEDLVSWVRDPSIQYLGATDDVRPWIEKSDCIVLPSYREGMPRIVMEAMAMERAVITTHTAGCRETVDEGITGFLVPIRNAMALAESMEKIIALGPDKRKQMGQVGREKALHEFDDKIIADKLISEIMPLVNDGRSKP
jgi:glycosyltransferase involved in cell wall biosynthesis